jgi:hypothetical protein
MDANSEPRTADQQRLMSERGSSLPVIWILILVLAVLTWFFGWIVPVALFFATAAGVALHDWISHDSKCRWCNRVKRVFLEERGIHPGRLRTKDLQSFPTHMHIQVYVDGAPDIVVDIDFNEQILGIDPEVAPPRS